MCEEEKLYQLKAKISDNADKIKYLLNHVLENTDDREKFLFTTMAIDLAIAIKYYSADIEKYLRNK